jgi:hypothetical protein
MIRLILPVVLGLVAIPAVAQDELTELFVGLRSADETVRENSRQALVGYGHELIPHLVERLRQPDADVELLADLLQEAHRFETDAAAAATLDLDPAVEAFLGGRVEYAAGLLEREDLDGARSILDAVLALASEGPARTRAQRLRRQVKDELMRLAVVRGEVVTAGDQFAIDELIEVRLRLVNTGSAPLVIPLRQEQGGKTAESVLVATVVYRIYDPLGHMLSTSTDMRLELTEDIELGPGQAWETSFLVDPGQDHPTVMAVRTYTVSAAMRPVEVRLPTESLYRRIGFPEQELTVFPLGWEKVADRPLAYVGDALNQGNLHALAVACWLVQEDDLATCVGLLMESLRGSQGKVATVLMACLERLTGSSHGRDRAAWLHWWQNVRDDWQPPDAPGEGE